MSRRAGAARGLALALLLPLGCETTERVVPGPRARGPEPQRQSREARLKEQTEERPDDPRVWLDLGEYYEASREYSPAVAAYERFDALLEEETKRTGVRYTAGGYHLGRAYARARHFQGAVHHLNRVLALKPEGEEAALNPHFREAHYLLGGVFYESRQWKPAREHFLAFRALGGEPERVEPWLERIDEALAEPAPPTRPAGG
ncbi:MAG: tetratricopeptide repeat protein [Planctomycetes bacterium]|nr:tetratricopeptide repeat protein [Planctomycetota bacterium]